MNNDTFQWNDALVKEYLQTRLGDTYKDLEHFKQSKSSKKEWEIEDCFDNKGYNKSWHPYDKECQRYQCEIRSIRRLPDYQVFTVDDETSDGVIQKFELLSPSALVAHCLKGEEKMLIQIANLKKQPKKERIEVKDVGIESMQIKFEGRRLSVGKIEQVKKAIEKIINND